MRNSTSALRSQKKDSPAVAGQDSKTKGNEE